MLCGTNNLKNTRIMSPTKTNFQNSSTDTSNLQLMRHLLADQQLHQQYYLKGRLITHTQSTRTPPQRELLKTRSHFQKQKRVQELAYSEKVQKETFRITNKKKIYQQQRNFKSPKKTIKKFQISQNIVKQLNFKNKKIIQKASDQKELIVKNIFYRENRYYYSDQVIFSEILKRIYYQSWKIDDIKNYIQPCFKVISDQHQFLSILINEAKDFGNSIKKFLIKKIKKLIDNPQGSHQQRSFKKFNKNLKQYKDTIECLHNHYKHLESVNLQIERLSQIYYQNFIKDKTQQIEEEQRCHRRIFINCVYNDSLIRDFIHTFYQFLGRQTQYANYYQHMFLQVEEIYENLEQTTDMLSSTQSTDLATINTCDHIYQYCPDNYSQYIFSEDKKSSLYKEVDDSLEEQVELKKQKQREKRKRKKKRKQQKKQQEKLQQKKLVDQMYAIELEKRLLNIDKEYKNVKFQKVKVEFKQSQISRFNSLINSF